MESRHIQEVEKLALLPVAAGDDGLPVANLVVGHGPCAHLHLLHLAVVTRSLASEYVLLVVWGGGARDVGTADVADGPLARLVDG